MPTGKSTTASSKPRNCPHREPKKVSFVCLLGDIFPVIHAPAWPFEPTVRTCKPYVPVWQVTKAESGSTRSSQAASPHPNETYSIRPLNLPLITRCLGTGACQQRRRNLTVDKAKTPHPYFKRQALRTRLPKTTNHPALDMSALPLDGRIKNKGRVFLRHLEGEADDHD